MNNKYHNFKDNVFCLLHRDKANLLELYNGMNGTAYDNVEDLKVVTLSDAFCIQYRNDAAYTFNSDLCLYEQQSTENPNIPLRLLYYVSEEYKRIVPVKDLYSRSEIRIPTPHFVVFYNGARPQPEKQVYRLSALYEKDENAPELELTVTVLNINRGNNRELLAKCRTLDGYMKFVNKVRAKKVGTTTERAVREAVEECIQEGILRDFFMEHKEEVIGVGIFEYDEELARQVAHEDGEKQGRREAKKDAVMELLEDLGEMPQALHDKIYAQEDEEILKKWLKIAAKAESLEAFRAQI